MEELLLAAAFSLPFLMPHCSGTYEYCKFQNQLRECTGSTLVSMRIWIQLFTSMRIRILVRLYRHKKLNLNVTTKYQKDYGR
jgi:hypothetical protein